MTEKRSFVSTLLFFLIGALALWALAAAVSELPSYRSVTPSTHATEKHGIDAITAREALSACKNLKMQLCPEVPLGLWFDCLLLV